MVIDPTFGYEKQQRIGACFLISLVVQLLNCVRLFATPWTAARQAPLSSTVSWSLFEFMFIESVMLSISSSAAPFSFCLQSFPAPRYFPISRLFLSGGQSITIKSATPQILRHKSGMLGTSALNDCSVRTDPGIQIPADFAARWT